MKRVIALVWLWATVAAANPGVSASADPRLLTLDAGDRHTVMQYTPQGIIGEGVALSWQSGELTGRFLSSDVHLTTAGAVRGQLGAATVEVGLARAGDSFWMTGRWDDQPVGLIVGPVEIRGVYAGCTFALKANAGRYTGWRLCGYEAETPAQLTLSLPEPVSRLDDAKVAAIVAVLLAPREVGSAAQTKQTPARQTNELQQRFGLALTDESTRTLKGARVTAVVPGSAAARAGIEVGMVVTRAGLEDVTNAHMLEAALMRMPPRQTLVLQLRRPGHQAWIELEIAAPNGAT